MTRGRWAALLAVFLIATGCTPLTKVDLSRISPEEATAAARIAIINQAQLVGRRFTVLGIVEGVSCKQTLFEPAASRAAATEQAKYYAMKLGADGIVNLQFADNEGTSYQTNCWELIRVSAEAIKFEADSTISR